MLTPARGTAARPARPARRPLRAALAGVACATALLGTVATAAPAGAATTATSGSSAAAQPQAAHRAAVPARAARPARGTAAFGLAVLAEAKRHYGAPYVYGGNGPWSFDCSGFVRYVYARLGVSLPRTSWAQYGAVRHVPASQARPGDILFVGGLGHVAIYAGHGMMVDAPSPGGYVRLRPIYAGYEVGRVG